MGFTLNRTYALRFSGALEGLEVDIRSTSAGVVMQLREVAQDDPSKLAELLAEHMIRWNYEDGQGEPVPCTKDGLLSVELPLVAEVAKEWYRAATGISAPLAERSTSGLPPLEGSIPMETL